MTFLILIIIAYSSLSFLSLFNNFIRYEYIDIFDEIKYRTIYFGKGYKKIDRGDYTNLLVDYLGDILILLILFISSPIVVVYHLAKGIKTPHRAKKHRYKSINPNYSKSPIFLNIKKEIPFIPISKQVIYFESHFNDMINEFISSNHNLILEEFKLKGYDFVYLPISVENMDRDIAFYFNPSVVYTEIEKNNLISYESIMSITSVH